MQVKKIVEQAILDTMTPEQEKAVLDSIAKTVSEAKELRKQQVDHNVDLVLAGLKKVEAKMVAQLGEEAKKFQKGLDGKAGKDGKDGKQGPKGDKGNDGRDGKDGKDGKDGRDGLDGVSVIDARVDFDGSLTIILSDGTEINAGEVVPADAAQKIHQISHQQPAGTGSTSQEVLDALAAIQATIATYGTMATQNANNVAITGGAINGTTIGAVTPAAGTFTTLSTGALTATGQTDLGTGSSNYLSVTGAASSANVFTSGSSTNISMFFRTKGTGAFNFTTNNSFTTQQFAVSHTASAVNYVQVTGAATGAAASIQSTGSDATQTLLLLGRGNGGSVTSGASSTVLWFKAAGTSTGTVVNYLQANASTTTNSPILSAQGSDTNISQVFQSKGTGAIDLAAGSSGVNISNGGTVTAITRTAAGTSYTSIPSVAISVPTTAGGVQAVGNVALEPGTFTIVNGGSGYAVNDIVEFTSGTFYTQKTRLTVTTVSAGAITGVSIAQYGRYTVMPNAPDSVTTITGTGTGATISVATSTVFAVIITNAGSGYVEQPTVSFSGGGGSGAAAYATVGSGTVVKSVGSTMSFYTPSGGIAIQLQDSGTATPGYLQLTGGNGGSVNYVNGGNASNTSLYWVTKGTGLHSFSTNGTSGNQQFAVAHTASAVNYVQVTGAATGSNPTISAQGSDANVNLNLQSKGTGYLNVLNNRTNYFQFYGGNTGQSPTMYAWGSDTNIDLALTPKGTGSVVVSSNNLLVGTATTSLVTGISAARLSVSGSGDGITVVSGAGNDTINVAKSGTPSGTWIGFFSSAGTGYGNITVNGAGTAYNTTSDYRLKNIDGPLVGAKDFILALKPKQGTWKADGSKFVGFVADEFQKVSPTSVTGEKDAVDEEGKPVYQTMQASSSEVMANLIALVQEQQAIIEQLTKRIEALE